MKERIIGIDVARALAVIGMIVVNFKMVFGQQGDSWLKHIAKIFEGKAAATFVVLAGVGLAMMTNTAFKTKDTVKWKKAQFRIIKRALALFIIGISYIVIWPADILHFYGIYMLITLLVIQQKPVLSLILAIVLIFLYPLMMFIFSYDIGWNFATMEYQNFWSPEGFIRNLFYNGFHPVIPWSAFMLIGLWFGRQNLQDIRFVRKAFWISFTIFAGTLLVSKGLISFLSAGDVDNANELTQVLGTNPMPPLPIYMISGSSIAIAVISICILISKRFKRNFIIKSLVNTGQLALTFYVAHVVIGMGVVQEISSIPLGKHTVNFSVIYALLFSLGCILFAMIWKKYKTAGPLEWVLRKITN